MIHCTGRGSECACTASTCVCAPAKPIKPVNRLSPMTQVFVIIALYAFAGSAGLTVWYAALSNTDEHYRVEFLDKQEANAYVKSH